MLTHKNAIIIFKIMNKMKAEKMAKNEIISFLFKIRLFFHSFKEKSI